MGVVRVLMFAPWRQASLSSNLRIAQAGAEGSRGDFAISPQWLVEWEGKWEVLLSPSSNVFASLSLQFLRILTAFFYFSCISFLHLYLVLSLNLLVCLCASFSIWFPLSWVLRIPEWRRVKMTLWAEAHNYMLEPWIPSTSWFSEHSCDSTPQSLSQEQTEFQNLSFSCLLLLTEKPAQSL